MGLRDEVVKRRPTGGYRAPRMDEVDPTPAIVASQASLSIDDFPFWVDAGTLLGLHRDGRPIPHDKDVDWAVRVRVGPVPTLRGKGWRLIRTLDWRRRPMQRAYQHATGTVVDLYYYWEGLAEGLLVNVNDVGVIATPAGMVTRRSQIACAGLTLPAPTSPDEYLAWRYGPTWRVPAGVKGAWADDCDALQTFDEWEGLL